MYWNFFFNDTATTEIYTYGHTLSLHDALPILSRAWRLSTVQIGITLIGILAGAFSGATIADTLGDWRSEEHTSELQSLMRISYAVFCMKKNTTQMRIPNTAVHVEQQKNTKLPHKTHERCRKATTRTGTN